MSTRKRPKRKPQERKRVSARVTMSVLTEAGYRCAVPTCRCILALDMHHIWEVSAGGGTEPFNLIALCPTCHRLYHTGHIAQDSIHVYKAMLISLSNAFDVEALDRLLFLDLHPDVIISGDGALTFARLIAAGLARLMLVLNEGDRIVHYNVALSKKGTSLVEAWKSGNRTQMNAFFGGKDK